VFFFGLAPPARKCKKREKKAGPHVWSSVSFSCVACYCDRFQNVPRKKRDQTSPQEKPISILSLHSEFFLGTIQDLQILLTILNRGTALIFTILVKQFTASYFLIATTADGCPRPTFSAR
jgi:hypothetical protein